MFKAYFKTIVLPYYSDIYALKETYLHGTAYELVQKLENIEKIWKRLSEKYGDAVEIVDAVIKDLQNVVI